MTDVVSKVVTEVATKVVTDSDDPYVWLAPRPDEVGATPIEFLHKLPGPCWLVLPGRDRSRSRVIATLLHGNEPSGLIATHRCILAGIEPAVDIHIFIGSVAAARKEPLFSNRFLSDHRDLNRCFRPPFDDQDGGVAEKMLAYLSQLRPQCLIDIHNTSGAGPAFSVSPFDNRAHRALTELFTHRMIITELRLGALMEVATPDFEAITVECGGANDDSSHDVAYRGLVRYLTQEVLFTDSPTLDSGPDLDPDSSSSIFEVFDEPLRFELIGGTALRYGEGPIDDADITIPANIENYNFGDFHAHQILAWLESSAFEQITVKDLDGNEVRDDYFEQRGGCLFVKRSLRLFMATTRADIALSDCLFYFVVADQIST
ncbi:MAG: succinylglutamate desuccinylase [Porticoccaceae bacterium]|nr:succinylglutamate desuccinylase [Porticoccaceae bacterium]